MAGSDSEKRWSPALALLHPAWWASLAILLVNDHVLKGSGLLGVGLTGILSDFAGLLMAPAVIAVLAGVRGRGGFVAAHIVVGGVFAALKLSETCAAAWCGLGAAVGWCWQVVCDETDLVALPMLALSMWLFGARLELPGTLRARWRQTFTVAGQAVGLLGILATSRPPPKSPVLTASSVYVGESDELVELDRATGARRRVVDFDLGWHTEPKIVGDLLYAADGGTLRARELSTGRIRWEKDGLGSSLGIVDVDEKKVVVGSDDAMSAFDSRTGVRLWQASSERTFAVATRDRVAALNWSGALTFYALADGRPLARATLPEATTLAVHEGALYALAGGQLLELDSVGAVRRRAGEPLIDSRFASQRFPARNLLVRAGALENSERVGELVSIDASDFRVRWRLPGADVVETTQNVVFTVQGYACNGLPPLAARDATTGRVLWSTPWCHWGSSLAADDGIVVSYDRAEATAWDTITGSVRWRVTIDD